jgi:hypothetical protein
MFRGQCSIGVIDCWKLNERVKTGPVDNQLEFNSKEPVAHKTTAFCVILHVRVVKHNPLNGEIRRLI